MTDIIFPDGSYYGGYALAFSSSVGDDVIFLSAAMADDGFILRDGKLLNTLGNSVSYVGQSGKYYRADSGGFLQIRHGASYNNYTYEDVASVSLVGYGSHVSVPGLTIMPFDDALGFCSFAFLAVAFIYCVVRLFRGVLRA